MERYISWSEMKMRQNYSCAFCILLLSAEESGLADAKCLLLSRMAAY
jgi:hypothetical protein